MRNAMIFVTIIAACIMAAILLSGCAYSSANMLRAQGKEINVLGAWGWVKCVDSSVTMYRSTDAIAYLKDKDAKYPKIPARPTIQEEAESSSLNIGRAQPLTPKPATPHEDSGPIAAVAQAVIGK